jgi:hypothetical protein
VCGRVAELIRKVSRMSGRSFGRPSEYVKYFLEELPDVSADGWKIFRKSEWNARPEDQGTPQPHGL